MRGQLSDDERREIDARIGKEPIEPVLDLWEAMVRAGGMPAMTADHVRAILVAFQKQRAKD